MSYRFAPPSARMRAIKKKAVAAPVAKAEPKESPSPFPEYNDRMLKKDLLVLAKRAGLGVSAQDTKKTILKALDQRYGK